MFNTVFLSLSVQCGIITSLDRGVIPKGTPVKWSTNLTGQARGQGFKGSSEKALKTNVNSEWGIVNISLFTNHYSLTSVP